MILAALLVVGQLLDALTFMWFFHIVPPGFEMAEQNPIVLLAMAIGGVGLVVLIKLGVASYIAWRWTIKGWRPKTRAGRPLIAILFPLAIASGYVGFAFNSWAIIQLNAL